MTITIGIVAVKGGAGSGNWGHAGRPGLVGGSGGRGGRMALSESTADAVAAYTGDSYDHINALLRGSLEPGDVTDYDMSRLDAEDRDDYVSRLHDMAGDLDSFVHQHTVTTPRTVYRGLDATHLNQLREGDTFEEPGFTSATSSARVAAGQLFGGFKLVMNIRLKPGDRAVDMEQYSTVPKEQEWLLPMGTTFRFVREQPLYIRGKVGAYQWDVEVVQ